MNHNLTQKQLEALRWLMNQIKVGELEESILIVKSVVRGIVIGGFNGDVPDIFNSGVLDTLIADGALVVNDVLYTVTKRAYEIIAFDFNNPQPDPLRTFILETYKLMNIAFNREEFSQLCFEININPEWVLGDSRDWPFELLQYLYRHNRLNELPSILRKKRPKIDWLVFPNDSEKKSYKID